MISHSGHENTVWNGVLEITCWTVFFVNTRATKPEKRECTR